MGEVKRCEEMERKLRYIQREAIRDEVEISEPEPANPLAPAPREMSELETALSNLERDLSDVNTNYAALRKNQLELLELKSLLMKTESFLHENTLQLADSSGDEDQRSKAVFFTHGKCSCQLNELVLYQPFLFFFFFQIFSKVRMRREKSSIKMDFFLNIFACTKLISAQKNGSELRQSDMF